MAPRPSVPACRPALLARLCSSDVEVQCKAAGELNSLALDGPSMRAAIVAAGGADTLVRCLRSLPAASEAALLAATALSPLVLEQAGAAAVVAAGTLPCLVQALLTGACAGAHGHTVLAHVATGLEHPARANANAMLEAGVLPVLLSILRGSTAANMETAAHLLTQLGRSAEARAQLVPAVTPLLRCLDGGPPALQAASARALSSLLSGCPAATAAVAAAGGAPLLLQCMASGSRGITTSAALATAVLTAGDVPCKRAVVQAGGAEVAVQCLRAAGSGALKHAAANALRNLCAPITMPPSLYAERAPRVVAAGGVRALLAVLESSDESSSDGMSPKAANCIALVNVLNVGPAACAEFAAAGGIPWRSSWWTTLMLSWRRLQ